MALFPGATYLTFSPASGGTNTKVNLFTDAESATGVQLNGLSVPLEVDNNTGNYFFRVPQNGSSGRVKLLYLGGSITSTTNFTVTGAPVDSTPRITSFSPATGPGGTRVTVMGQNLENTTAATIGGRTCLLASVPISTMVVIDLPGNAQTGRIVLTNPSGTTTSLTDFIVPTTSGGPRIDSFAPTSGKAGDVISLYGAGFNSVTGVALSGKAAAFDSGTDTMMFVTVPSDTPSGKFSITSASGTASSLQTFTVTAQLGVPTINSFSPASGKANDDIILYGQNLGAVDQVTFNLTPAASITLMGNLQLKVKVPVGATSGRIRARNAAGEAVSATDFVVNTPLEKPVITNVSPTTVMRGDTLEIVGQYYATVTSVQIGGAVAMEWSREGDSIIRAKVPQVATTGRVVLTNPAGATTSGQVITVLNTASLSITSFGPTSGGSGSRVDVFGTGFLTATEAGIGTKFTTQVTKIDDTHLHFNVPSTATSGRVTVRNNSNSASSNMDFNVIATQVQGPVILTVNPRQGPLTPDAQTPPILINGTGFQQGAKVWFATVPATVLEVKADGTQIKVEQPTGMAAGLVDLRVDHPDGSTVTLADAFQYLAVGALPRAVIHSISPLNILAGGVSPTTITIKGRHLIQANVERLLALRCPNTISLEIGAYTTSIDPESGDDVVRFPLKVNAVGGIGANDRVMIQFLASLRPRASEDLLVEDSSHYITVVSGTAPVVLGYTNTVGGGESQVVMVVGRNLQGMSLSLVGSAGVEVLDSRVEDRFAALIISVPDAATFNPGSLMLTNPSGVVSGSYGLTKVVGNANRTSGKPLIPKIVQAPGQRPVAPTKGASRAYRVRDGQPLAIADPKPTNAANLVPGVQVSTTAVQYTLPIYDEIAFISLTDRGGSSGNTVNRLERKVGRIVTVRNLDILMVLQTTLTIRLEIVAFLGLNPFNDYASTVGFNAFGSSSPAGTFGTVTLQFQFQVTYDFGLSYVAALVRPPQYVIPSDISALVNYPDANPNRAPALVLDVIDSFSLSFLQPDDLTSLSVVGRFFRVELPASRYPVRLRYIGGPGLRPITLPGLSAAVAFPEPSAYGLVGYFFAEARGTYCFEWQREDMVVRMGLLSAPNSSEPLFIPPTRQVCLTITNQPTYIYAPVPKMPEIELGTAELIWLYRIRVENAGMPGETRTVEDKFIDPSSYEILSDDPAKVEAVRLTQMGDPTDRVKDWYLRGKVLGSANLSMRIDPNLANAQPMSVSAGNAPLLPSQNPQFEPLPNVLLGLLPTIVLPVLNKEMTLCKGTVIPLGGSTKALRDARSRLWKDYVEHVAPSKTPMAAWGEVSFARRAIFLLSTHRLYWITIETGGVLPEDLKELGQINNSTLLSNVTQLLTLRDDNAGQGSSDSKNRIFFKASRLLARAINFYGQPATSKPYTLDDAIIVNSVRPLGIGAAANDPYQRKLFSDSMRGPKFSLLLLADTQYYENGKPSVIKLGTILDRLRTRTAVVGATNDLQDQILLRAPTPSLSMGNQVCASETAQVFEMFTEFNKDQLSTETLSGSVTVEGVKMQASGRRMYASAFATGHTVDWEWTPDSPLASLATEEELFGRGEVLGVSTFMGTLEDFMLSKEPYGMLLSAPKTAVELIAAFKAAIAMAGDTGNAAKLALKAACVDFGTKFLARARAAVREADFAKPDDRQLYWGRNKMSYALRTHGFMQRASAQDADEIIRALEDATRGYSSIQFPATADLKVVILGFDPFFFNILPFSTNPSGYTALGLHGKTIQLGARNVSIQSAIVPVRYADFEQDCGAGVVEAVVARFIDPSHPQYTKVDMVISLSQDGADKFQLDRFATRFRIGDPDNNAYSTQSGLSAAFPFSLPGDPFYFTTLPIAKMVPPTSMANGNLVFFRNNFQYQTGGTTASYSGTITGPVKVEDMMPRPPALVGKTPEELKNSSPTAFASMIPSVGSGSAFLSNEIFYRISRLRALKNPNLMTGHIHLPFRQSISENPDFDYSFGKKVITEVQEIIKRGLM